MDMTTVFAPITKTVEQDDGSVLVYGKATDGGLDGDLQRCSPSWLATAMPAWYSSGGNVREQHDSKRAIGKAVDHEVDGDAHYVTARIVDPVAVLKTKAGVFNGFSIGIARPKISKSADAPNGVIDGGSIIELSLCDRPSNASCLITLVKSATPGMEINAADFDEERGLVRCEELVEKTAEPEEPPVPTLAETLAPESLEKLAAAVEPAELPEPAVEVEPVAEKAVDAEAADTPAAPSEAPSFDVDAAKALVAASLAKAEGDDMATFNPVSDEDLATTALSIIARLIQSEAGNMVANPGEDDDIRCLLSAVASLRWYVRRERQEGDIGGTSDASPYEYAEMAATPDAPADTKIVVKNDVSPEMVAAVAKAAGKTHLQFRNEGGDLLDPTGSLPVQTKPSDAPEPIAKTTDADTVKAAVVEDEDPGDALVKALTAALSKSDNPLRKTFQDIVTASTEATAEAVSDLAARLVKVESMAVPGGPALRRTEVERTSARANDLALEVRRFKSLATNATDVDLRQGYAAKAAQLEAEFKAISA